MVFNILFTDRASQQLTEALVWYGSPNKKKALIKEVDKILLLISRNPLLFPIDFEHYRRAVLQKFPYVIIYFVVENDVIITSFFHTSQNPVKRK